MSTERKEALFEAINLDGLSTEAKDYKEASETLATLAAYAKEKGKAMECRAKGNIPGAMATEHILEDLYDRLPTWARW